VSRRFFRHGELPLVLLALVSERPRHGYELMSELARLFGPAYRPSPGSVYPAVEALQAEGLIEPEAANGRVSYRASPEGVEALEERATQLAALEVRTGARVRRSDSLGPILARFQARVAPLSGRVDPQAVARVLDRTATEIESLNGLETEEHRP
jgi:DNA-binding PadR family transcriptional regulator